MPSARRDRLVAAACLAVLAVALLGGCTRSAHRATGGPATFPDAMLAYPVAQSSRIVVAAVTKLDRVNIGPPLPSGGPLLAHLSVQEGIVPPGDVSPVVAFATDLSAYSPVTAVVQDLRPWREGDRLLAFLRPDVAPGSPSAALQPPHLEVIGRILFKGGDLDAGFNLADLRNALASLPPSESTLTATAVVRPDGMGPVRVGMTLGQASRAAKRLITLAGPPIGAVGSCSYAQPQGGPEGVWFMISGDLVARIDVTTTAIATAAGARVGMDEATVKGLYPGMKVEPAKYVEGGHTLVYEPPGGAGPATGIIFDTDGTKVVTIRSGREPELSYVEGCG